MPKPKGPRSSVRDVPEDVVVDAGTDKDYGVSLSRYNPFTSSPLSLDELLQLETTGKLSTFLSSASSDKSRKIVEKALSALVDCERDFIIDYFFMGMTLQEIATKNEMLFPQVVKLKEKSIRNLKILILKARPEFGVTRAYNKCVICDHPKVDDIDIFLQEWLEGHGWKFQGILKALRSQFSVSVSALAVVISHIRFHLGLSALDIYGDVGDEIEDAELQQISISISLGLKRKIKLLSKKYGLKHTEVLRQCIKLGAMTLENMLSLNVEYFKAAQDLVRIMNILK